MIRYEDIGSACAKQHLSILGGFHPTPEDKAPNGAQTLVMLGPREPGFWAHLQTEPEFSGDRSDPMDDWSHRVITDLAQELGATALYPFGGPPFHPFFSWAVKTGRCHPSPVQLLVHDEAGLMVSFRGALAFPHRIDLPAPPPNPCLTCVARPCLSTCPVDALSPDAYDVPACRSYLSRPEGSDCLDHGCAARRACPVSQRYGRVAAQSGYHMRRFLGG